MITLTVAPRNFLDYMPVGGVTWPMAAAGGVGLLLAAGLAVVLVWTIRRASRTVTRAIETERLTVARVLIVVAIVAALGVAVIGGARSFRAVSVKFDSALVPLVADGMIVACTALRLAALTRGWRIPGALVTTYVFIGGTVWLNIDTATGVADAVAHALAPLAYAVLVEMLAHLLRLHMKLAQPARAKLSALTWFTSPVITTRVWLHLARTGTDDPTEARALVQQIVRMASRLATICPSHRLWPLDAANAARSACLQTIRDGLLSASDLAALLPPAGRLTPGELLALVDSAALGLTAPTAPAEAAEAADPDDLATAPPPTAPVWLVAYLLGALRVGTPAPVHDTTRTDLPAPVHRADRTGASAPVHAPHRTDTTDVPTPAPARPAPSAPRARRSDNDDLTDLRRVSDTEHAGAPLPQREIMRVLNCGFPKARRLADLAGWLDPDTARPASGDDQHPETTGQLQRVSQSGETPIDDPSDTDDQTSTDHELETSSSR